MKFIIHLLWLTAVVALSLGWRMQIRDLLDINASLTAERDASRLAYNRLERGCNHLEVEHIRNRNDLLLIIDSIRGLEIDVSHLVSTARIAKNDGNGRGVRVIVEPVPPRSLKTPPGMDVSL